MRSTSSRIESMANAFQPTRLWHLASWQRDFPAAVEQGVTAVLPAYRKRGIAHWLKAALLDKLVQEQPAARYVRTGNAASNTAMLKTNADMGFAIISEDMWWELELTQVQRYLHTSRINT